MRRSHISAREEEEQNIDLTPMLDVVFIMLIFFIVTASFVKEAGLDVNRPEASDLPPPPPDKLPILITLTNDGDIIMDGRRIDKRSIKANVARQLAEDPNAALIINSEPKAKVEFLAAAIDGGLEAGVPSNRIITNTREN